MSTSRKPPTEPHHATPRKDDTIFATLLVSAVTAVTLLALSPVADARDEIDSSVAPRKALSNGDHPAVVMQRLRARQGHDYASSFYPHPAWLYLLPGPTEERPATTAQVRATSPAPRRQ